MIKIPSKTIFLNKIRENLEKINRNNLLFKTKEAFCKSHHYFIANEVYKRPKDKEKIIDESLLNEEEKIIFKSIALELKDHNPVINFIK